MANSKLLNWTLFLVIGGGISAYLGNHVRSRLEIGETPPDRLAPLLASNQKDPEVPESENFLRVVELLKDNYVDAISDERKLAYGAVKGMIASLADADSVYMDAQEFAAYKDRLRGKLQGIGAELRLVFTADQLDQLRSKKKITDIGLLVPKLVVTSVAPGGPAAKAGLQVGDRIDSVDNKWVISSEAIKELRELQRLFDKQQVGPEKLTLARERLREQATKGTMPARARDMLTIGTSGSVHVRFERDGTTQQATLAKTLTTVAPLEPNADGSYSLRVIEGAANQLTALVAQGKPITLDLRNGGQGSPAAVKACLAAVAPGGNFGEIATDRSDATKPFAVQSNTTVQVPMTLLVDQTVRGSAEIFALALSSKGFAKLKGSTMAGDRKLIETVALDDGSGYAIATGVYRTSTGKSDTVKVKK